MTGPQPSSENREDGRVPTIVLDIISEAYICLDSELQFTFANRAAGEILGVPPATMIGKTPWEVHEDCAAPEVREKLIQIVRDNSAADFEVHFRAANRWCKASAIPTPSGDVVIRLTDVTERKLEEDRFRHIFDDGSAGMFRTTPDGRVLAVNPAYARILRYDSPEDVLANVRDLGRDVWMTPVERARFLRIIEQQGSVRGLECRHKCKDGAVIVVSLQCRRIPGPGGQTQYYEGFLEDITERREQQLALAEAEEAVRDRERHLSTIYSSVADALFLLAVEPGPSYRFVTVNQTLLNLTGLQAEDVVGKTVDEVIPEPSLSLVKAKYREASEKGKAIRWEEQTIYPAGVRWGSVVVTPIFDGHGRCTQLAGLVHDLTEAKQIAAEKERLEEQLRQAQKLESIGRLAGGIAHDFNNLLTIINGYAGLLLDQLGSRSPLHVHASQIQKAGEHGASLVGQLLAFSRKQVIQPRPLDLNHAVSEAQRMLQRIMGEDVECRTTLASEPIAIMADPAQIHQVLLNLAANARDAMPQGGCFEVTTASIAIDAGGEAAQRGLVPGRYALLQLSDTGTGMTEEIRRNIFEPFFTTKQLGTGSGLGLATVYGIVRQSGGWIEVDSQPGQGTCFRIFLPRIDSASVADETPSASAVEASLGERVLVVEDDDGVRVLTTTILRELGYTVLEAANAEEASQLAAETGDPIQLLLTDVIMPGMNGLDLSRRLRVQNPKLKVLLMSGYSENVLAANSQLDREAKYLQKPFTAQSLAAKVREALGS